MAGNYTKDEQRFLKRLGQAIKGKRLAQELSQEGLAELTGLHRTYVGSVERGERNVSALNIRTFAKALGCMSADFLQGLD